MVFSKHKDILIDLLKSITGKDIVDLDILSKDFTLDKYKENGKFGVLDVMTELSDGTMVDIEIQVANEQNTVERFLYYQSGMYYQSIKKGESYSKTKSIIVIGILDFEEFIENYSYFTESEYTLIQKDDSNNIHIVESLNNKLKMYLIELPKFRKREHNLNRKIDQWLIAINGDNENEIGEVVMKNVNVKKALHEVRKLTANEELLEMFNREDDERRKANDMKERYTEIGIKQGIKQGIEQGIDKGIKITNIEIAKKMIRLGESIDKIILITGLKQEEIEKLVKE